MRLRLLPYALAATLLLHFSACKKSNTLPDATQTGANTFGCKINGTVFIPQKSPGDIGSFKDCAYEYINDIYDHGYFFQLSGSDSKNRPIRSVGVYTDCLPIHVGEFELKSWKSGNAYGTYFLVGSNVGTNGSSSKDYYTTDAIPGKLIITKFDETKQIVSGTFSFTAISSDGDTVKITEGRFDMPYTR